MLDSITVLHSSSTMRPLLFSLIGEAPEQAVIKTTRVTKSDCGICVNSGERLLSTKRHLETRDHAVMSLYGKT